VLKQTGLLSRWKGKPSRKGFEQPLVSRSHDFETRVIGIDSHTIGYRVPMEYLDLGEAWTSNVWNAIEETMDIPPQEFKILVADDSPVYRKLLERALSQKQYSVLFAKSGGQAMDLFGVHQPALLITDWMMPNITGIELCERIRRDFKTSYVYIIILTSMTDTDKVVSGLTAGADDYLTKPFHPAELLARVGVGRRVIDLHRQIEAKNRLLEELALTDALTGLPNRRAVEAWAARQLNGAARHGFAFWVVMADLDRFKSVNDTYGHDAGDTVLKKFAEILRANTRSSNICARIGGEEFLIVLTHAERDNVEVAIERIREQVQALRLGFGDRSLCVTASFGISGLQGRAAPDFDLLVKQADLALYSAKHNGRNRIEFSSV
jgi:diguanylate cyclase (GGDEF)-like protein